jgi:Domain of unknown function (DUF4262)
MPSVPQQKIAADIATAGFSILTVFDPEGQLPTFGYTVGLHRTAQHPEVIMIGLTQQRLLHFLDLIGRTVLAGARYEAGSTTTELTADGSPCFFGVADLQHYEEYLGQAIEYYAGQPFPALQCLWGDTQRRFPWQAGFEERFRAVQPVLFDPVASGYA